MGLAAVATAAIDPATQSLQAERVQQSLEEVVARAAGLCLLGAMVLRLLPKLVTGASSEVPART